MKQNAINAVYIGLCLLFNFCTAADISVNVGASGFVFTPDTVTANAGDVIEFVISSGHSVAQSGFNNPCQPIGASAIYSGFASGGSIFSVTVNSSDTLWFYCSASGHCPSGMAMVVNPPSSGNTLAAYKSAAKNAGSSSPALVQGGVFGAPSSSPSSSASPTSSQAPTTSTTPSQTPSATPSPTPSSTESPTSSPSSAPSSAPGIISSVIPSAASGPPTGSPTTAAPATFTGHGEMLTANFALLSLMVLLGLAVAH